MRTTLASTIDLEHSVRAGLTLSFAFASMLAVSVPSHARDHGAVAAGVAGLAVGALVGAAAASHHAPPPPPPTKVKYVPVHMHSVRPAPRHCYYEKRVDYDGADYVHSKVKVCQEPRPAPRHCWYEARSAFDGQDYVHGKVKVCR